MIQLKDITFAYTDKTVLDHVDFRVDDGQFVGLIGLNGAGKSTLLKIVMRLKKPQRGTIVDTFQRRSFVSQVTSTSDLLFPATVQEIVSLGLKWRPFSFLTKADKRKIQEALDAMGVGSFAKRSIGELSGGQQQRVRLAKALVGEPDLLILDEPTTGMDEDGRKEFLALIERMHRQRRMTIVLVSHAKEELREVDVLYRLRDGRIVREEGNCPIHEENRPVDRGGDSIPIDPSAS